MPDRRTISSPLTIHPETRAAGSGNSGLPTLTGYAAVFNSWSADLGGFREKLSPGCFADCLRQKPDVRGLQDHDPSRVFCRTTNGTLILREDPVGLWCEMHPADTQAGRDIVELVRRGDVSNMSFAFTVSAGGDQWVNSAGTIERTLTKIYLLDVSPVTYPAYRATSVQAQRSPEPDPRRAQLTDTFAKKSGWTTDEVKQMQSILISTSDEDLKRSIKIHLALAKIEAENKAGDAKRLAKLSALRQGKAK